MPKPDDKDYFEEPGIVDNKRIVKKLSWDNPPKPYWRIEEIVTSTGLYIELPGMYASEEAAKKALREIDAC